MKCVHCQGRLERSKAPFHIDRKGMHLGLDSVPAWVCPQCGEAYFDECAVERIQELIRAVDERIEALAGV
jgi:YgiT-type zinc finger domain-containing protein